MTEALRRVRNSRNEKCGARRRDHQVTSGNRRSILRIDTRWSKRGTVASGTDWSDLLRTGKSDYPRLKMHVYLERERQMVPFVNETGEANALERDALFILKKLTKNGVSRGMHPSQM